MKDNNKGEESLKRGNEILDSAPARKKGNGKAEPGSFQERMEARAAALEKLPPSAVEIESEVKRLAEEPDYAYDAIRADAAKRLRIRTGTLDKLRDKEQKRGKEAKREAAPAAGVLESGLPDWVLDLQVMKNGYLAGNAATVTAFLRNDERLIRLFAYNELSGEVWIMRKPPWRAPHKDEYPKQVAEEDFTRLVVWMASQAACGYQVREPAIRVAQQAIAAVATDHPWHPIREWLESLEWDGVPRVDVFLSDVMEVGQTPYLAAVSRVLLIAACRRIDRPGCKMDYMPILVSEQQGYWKSTFVYQLYGESWSRTLTPRAITSGDAGRELQGVWAVEMPELEAMRKADVEAVKALVSQQSDSWVPKYVENVKHRPRVPLIIGTTNNPTPLLDATGNRRFLMIVCVNPLDIKMVRANRAQLFAEAWTRRGESVLLKDEAWDTAVALQEESYQIDDWEGDIQDWLVGRMRVRSLLEIWVDCLNGKKDQYHYKYQGTRIGSIMRRIGWGKYGGGKDGRYWRRKHPETPF